MTLLMREKIRLKSKMNSDDTQQEYSYVVTDDGTLSVHVNEYGQAMHSTSGAYNEALYKHVIPSGLLEIKKEEISILDVGFGLGYNILAFIAAYEKRGLFRNVHVVSLENDPDVVNKIRGITFNDHRDELYRKIEHAVVKGNYSDARLTIQVIFGDARQTLPALDLYQFDAVFHDPFSPAKNPELWTVEFFTILSKLVKPEAIITTYSAALQVRRAMLEAGFTVGRGPSVGGKKEGTLATIAGKIASLPNEEIEAIMTERKGTPYRDVTGADSRISIIQRRKKEMKQE